MTDPDEPLLAVNVIALLEDTENSIGLAIKPALAVYTFDISQYTQSTKDVEGIADDFLFIEILLPEVFIPENDREVDEPPVAVNR